jgi:hypothetical protein
MSDTIAPAAAPSLSVSDGPLSLDEFVAMENAEAAEPEADLEEEAADASADDEPEEEVEASAEDDGETEEEEPEEIAEPEIPAPQSWSKEDAEAWAKLTPEARAIVAKREADRDRAVAHAVQKASEAGKQVQAAAQQLQEFARLGADAFEQKWQEKTQGPIDWAAALRGARDDAEFDAITRNKALYDAERTEVERAKAAAAERNTEALQAFRAAEVQKLPELAPELCDPKTGLKRVEAVVEFLNTRGFGDAIAHVSAAELSIASLALDGLKYREAQSAAQKQAAIPRKNPVSQAKAVPGSTGQGVASPQRTLQVASQKLTKSGSLNDLVELFNAEDAQKARKGARR